MTALAASLRLAAALSTGAHLVARPRGVVHIAPAGPLTPTLRALPRTASTVGGCRTGRLYEFTPGVSGVAASGRRFCRQCMALLVPSLGRAVHDLSSREDWLSAYGHLTASDLLLAARWSRTVEETHQVSRVALMVLGPAPLRRPSDESTPAYGVWVLEQELLTRRRRLRDAERSPEERAALVAEREAQVFNDGLITAARRKEDRIARAADRAVAGRYLMPHERDLLNSA